MFVIMSSKVLKDCDSNCICLFRVLKEGRKISRNCRYDFVKGLLSISMIFSHHQSLSLRTTVQYSISASYCFTLLCLEQNSSRFPGGFIKIFIEPGIYVLPNIWDIGRIVQIAVDLSGFREIWQLCQEFKKALCLCSEHKTITY